MSAGRGLPVCGCGASGLRNCTCPFTLEIHRVSPDLLGGFLDVLVGMRWSCLVKHPHLHSVLHNLHYGYTAKGVERKGRKAIEAMIRRNDSYRSIEVPREGRS